MTNKSGKTVSFIVATIGRETLKDTLSSIETYPGDEIIVIRQSEPLPKDFGNSGRNKGMEKATGDYLAFIDDDDVYLPGAREAMECAMIENINNFPIIFKMRYAKTGNVVWKDLSPKPIFECGNFGTPTIFVPNEKDKLAKWHTDPSYKGTKVGDFHFMKDIGWSWTSIIFRPEIIALVGKS